MSQETFAERYDRIQALRRAPEIELVWIEDPTLHDYVRVSGWMASSRMLPPSKRLREGVSGRVVGYAVWHSDVPSDDWSRSFLRRLFYVSSWDRSDDPHGVYETGTPSEGVDPLTLAPNEKGYNTPRSLGTER